MKKLEIGMKLRVFEVIKDRYTKDNCLIGKQATELPNKFYGHEFGVDLPLKIGVSTAFHFGIDERNEAKLIGCLTIKKLK